MPVGRPGHVPVSSKASALALWTLVGLAVVSPWPFGGVEPWAVRALTALSLLACVMVIALQARSGGMLLPIWPLWPLAALAALGLLQLLPLPALLHRALAPGSYRIWHPALLAAADILGTGPRPVSIDPGATVAWIAFASGLVLLAALAIPAASSLDG